MDGRIAELHCRYRVVGDATRAEPARARLDALARKEVPALLQEMLDQVFGDDPEVLILREAAVQVALDDAVVSRPHQIRTWSAALCKAVTRAIAQDPDEGNLMRFPDPGVYAACFVCDLLNDNAWRHWYYVAFQHLRNHPLSQALHEIIEEYRDWLPHMLAHLHREGALDHFLATLDPADRALLWPRQTSQRPDAVCALLETALKVLGALGLHDDNALKTKSLTSRYLASGAPRPDWRDQRSLAFGIQDAARFLIRQGYARPYDPSKRDPSKDLQTLQAFDWFDRAWLLQHLGDQNSPPQVSTTKLPQRHIAQAVTLTARQREIIQALAATVNAGAFQFDATEPASSENAIRWFAALIAQRPTFANTESVRGLIDQVLHAWAAVVRALPPHQRSAFTRNPEQDSSIQLNTYTKPSGDQARRQLNQIGREGRELVVQLLRQSGTAQQEAAAVRTGPQWLESPAARVLLLLRATTDARLPFLALDAAYPIRKHRRASAALHAALALRWSGRAEIDEVDQDPAFAAFADWPALNAQSLAETWAHPNNAAHLRFQIALGKFMHARRLVTGSACYLHAIGDMLVAGTGNHVWPFAAALHEETAVNHAWRDVFGEAPRIFTTGEDHARDQTELKHTLNALSGGQFGIPRIDCVLALAAAALLLPWRQWLKGFELSSAAYLLHNALQGPGEIRMEDTAVHVRLAPAPLDPVLRLAGYFSPLEIVYPRARTIHFYNQEA